MAPACVRALAVCALLAVAAAGEDPLIARRKKWSSMDLDKAAKSLEAGDEAEELVTEDAVHIADMERRKANPAAAIPEDPETRLKDPAEWARHSSAMTGPAMLFVTLANGTAPGGGNWANASKREFEELSVRWKELLKTAGIDAGVYEIGEGRLLLSLQSGWRAYDVRDFCLKQPETESVEWDSVNVKRGEAMPVKAETVEAPKDGESMIDSLSRTLQAQAKAKAKAAKRAAREAAKKGAAPPGASGVAGAAKGDL